MLRFNASYFNTMGATQQIHRILVIEDEKDIADAVLDGLRNEGFEVDVARDGQTAIRYLNQKPWDLIILDLMLPDISGESILSYLTQRPEYPSVLILTAKNHLNDKIGLFRKGCDDYLTKPFIFEELLVRVEALLRRPPRVQPSGFRYGNMELDVVTNSLAAGAAAVSLTPKETALFRLFIREPERILSRKELLQEVWGLKEEPSANYIGIHLFNLRKKLSEIERGDWLQTVRASGFVLCNPSVRQYGD